MLIIDEAQELTDAQFSSASPVTNAGPARNPLTILLGTPETEASRGEVFGRLRKNAIAGVSDDIAYIEWGARNIPKEWEWEKVEPLCYETNPSIGVLSDVRSMKANFASMERIKFAQEFLGYWLPSSKHEDSVIPEDEWSACETKNPPMGGNVSYGIRFSADGKLGAISACAVEDGCKPHIELVSVREMKDGTGYFADFIERRADDFLQLMVDGKSAAEALRNKLLASGLPKGQVWLANASGAATAASMLKDAVASKAITHFGQEQLTRSATQTAKRKIGNDGGFGFQSTDGADAAPIESAALAYMAAMTTKRQAEGEQFVW